jgi:UDP-glucose 4-epimerase
MKYVVIGGSGFIGQHIINEIASHDSNYSIINIDINNPPRGNNNIVSKFYRSNICQDNISRFIRDVDVVFLLAGEINVQESISDPVLYNNTNVNGVLKVLEQCRLNGVRRLIFSSSASVYGNTLKTPITEDVPVAPLSPYALQKHIGEQYCQLYSNIYNLDTICLRYFNVYGENNRKNNTYSSVINIFTKLKEQNLPLTIYGTGQQQRDFVWVQDVARANFYAGQCNTFKGGDIINIGTQRGTSIIELAKLYNHPINFLPQRIEPKNSIADITKAKKILNWSPTCNIKEWLISL